MKKDHPFYKGSLQTILLSLLREHGRMYGYEITRKVMELSDGKWKLTEGALYPMLHKMETDGLLEVSHERMDNRIRKYYSLTPGGKKETSKKLIELQHQIGMLQQILNLKLT